MIHALVPQGKPVMQVRLYAESDDSSMKYPDTKPIILKPDVPIKHGTKGNPVPINVNVTNISRDNVDFDWIIKIKKSPKSLDEGDITQYPESKTTFIDAVSADVMAQESKRLEYLWTPMAGGIYFYEMYMWDNGLPVSRAFTGGFLYSNEILVTSNYLKEQLASGTSFENLQCTDGLFLIQKHDRTPACVKPGSIPELVKRNWTTTEVLLDMPLAQLGKECGHYSHNEFLGRMQNHTLDASCHDYIIKKALEDEGKMLERGYIFDAKEQVWKKDGFPDTMMSISYHYMINLEAENED